MTQMGDARAEIILAQQTRLTACIAGLGIANQDYALLDFPDHPNVGDSAIWLGEIELLQRILGRKPAYVCDCNSLDIGQLRAAIGDGPVFLHGGGNFGDIYKWYQDFRLRILRGLRERRVIQLPQSISFGAPGGISETADAIAGHPDFHLLVRDRRSEAFARQHFRCPVHLMPDSAFCLGALRRPSSPSQELLLLLRTDEEGAHPDRTAFAGLPPGSIVDWLDEPPDFQARTRRIAAGRALLGGAWSANARRLVRYGTVAQDRVDRGLHLLSLAGVVITDRLHAHILSLLLGIPHVVLDNTYGKIASYMEAWTHGYPCVRAARTPAEAVISARDLLSLECAS